jgi:hypothetical protein
MSRKRKNISFFCLGKLKPKKRIIICSPAKQEASGIVLKRNEPANFQFNVLLANTSLQIHSNDTSKVIVNEPVDVTIHSTESDKQSKLLSNELPIRSDKKLVVNVPENRNKSNFCKANQTNIPMEIDNITPSTSEISTQEIVIEENAIKNGHFIGKQQISIEIAKNYEIEPINCDKQITEVDFEITENCKMVVSKNNENQSSLDKEIDVQNKPIDSEIYNLNKNNDRNSEVESNSDSQCSIIHKLKNQQEFETEKSICSSMLSSPVNISPLKKKRNHSESSNDEDVSCIIGKWCIRKEEPIIKKQKTVSDTTTDLNLEKKENKVDDLDDLFSDDNDNTLVNHTLKKAIINKKERDRSDDKTIMKTESFKENSVGVNKLFDVPNSLLSADLFESNDQCLQPIVESCLKPLNKITSDDHPLNISTLDKKNDKEHLDFLKNMSNITMVNLKQFDRNKSDLSEYSESSDKENNACNIDVNNAIKENVDNVDRVSEIGNSQNDDRSMTIKNASNSSQLNIYHVSDSLMNITQEQLAMKKIEKALIGVNLSDIHLDKNEEIDNNKLSTPRHKVSCFIIL